ncbi:MAG: class I SAM-dependent methyltransferase [Candidatus Eremiobacteraeota bacterium]|nr:class I SAM-dependent methyltransferase [Candidatus Eremiobacteraeota bacterium]
MTNATRPTLLELGSGTGNIASHLKRDFTLTLVEPSDAMLRVSRDGNPECEHVRGDMRSVRLGRTFDAVFVHDAIVYMTTHEDLARAIETAYLHCRSGGVALFIPDATRETFEPSIEHGGEDDDKRGVRWLSWSFDPDPTDTTYRDCYALILRDEDGTTRVEYEEHSNGLFSRAEWIAVLEGAGFRAERREEPYGRDVFLAMKP